MTHDFCMPAHTNNPSTKLIFQVGINAFNGTALVVTYCFGGFMTYQPATFIFSRYFFF